MRILYFVNNEAMIDEVTRAYVCSIISPYHGFTLVPAIRFFAGLDGATSFAVPRESTTEKLNEMVTELFRTGVLELDKSFTVVEDISYKGPIVEAQRGDVEEDSNIFEYNADDFSELDDDDKEAIIDEAKVVWEEFLNTL